MSLQVQDIVNAVSTDTRQVLSNSGSDATLMIGWVDRIHKDALHTGLFNNLIQNSTTFTSAPGTVLYTLTPPTTIRRIIGVYDSTFNRFLLPMAEAMSPMSAADQTSMVNGAPAEEQLRPKLALSQKTQSIFPEYYTFTGAGDNTISIFPPPVSSTFAGTMLVYYEGTVTTLANLTDVLVIPEDGKDMVVAGVNMLAHQFLKMDQEAALWAQHYERMKIGQQVV